MDKNLRLFPQICKDNKKSGKMEETEGSFFIHAYDFLKKLMAVCGIQKKFLIL